MENNKIIYYEQLDSTNTKIVELAKQGAKEGTVVVADSQTAGKGRRGRAWNSPAGENIYMSLLLRPHFGANVAPMLTLLMAYSVGKVLRAAGFDNVQIKWPNDLVLNNKKICGILTEMTMKETEIDHVVIGVGINVNSREFPKDLSQTATSLYLESSKISERKLLIEEIVNVFWDIYQQFVSHQNLSFVQKEYEEMLINKNKEVLVLEPGNEYVAYAKGINETGELLVQTNDGSERKIYAGEVSVRGVYGYV